MVLTMEFQEMLLMPLPLGELRDRAKKKHDITIYRNIERLINDVKNDQRLIDEIGDLMQEALQEETIESGMYQKIFDRSETIVRALRVIADYMNKLSQSERNYVWVSFFKNWLELVTKKKQELLADILAKEDWSEVDALFKGYYDLYILFIRRFYEDITNRGKFNRYLVFNSLFKFNAVIYAYLKKELNAETMIKNMAELATTVDLKEIELYNPEYAQLPDVISDIPPLLE